MGCRIEQLNRDTTKHFIFNNDILASAVGAVRGAVLLKIHYLQNIKGSHGNAMGLSDYSVGIIIVESEGHAPVKSGTVQKACTHLLGHCFGRDGGGRPSSVMSLGVTSVGGHSHGHPASPIGVGSLWEDIDPRSPEPLVVRGGWLWLIWVVRWTT